MWACLLCVARMLVWGFRCSSPANFQDCDLEGDGFNSNTMFIVRLCNKVGSFVGCGWLQSMQFWCACFMRLLWSYAHRFLIIEVNLYIVIFKFVNMLQIKKSTPKFASQFHNLLVIDPVAVPYVAFQVKTRRILSCVKTMSLWRIQVLPFWLGFSVSCFFPPFSIFNRSLELSFAFWVIRVVFLGYRQRILPIHSFVFEVQR